MSIKFKPIVLKGHERPLTQLVYNREGDLLFSASKGPKLNVWRSDTGERVGTYNGHNGAVWSVDVDFKTERLVTGSADNTTKLWDVQTGKELFTFHHRTPVRFVQFAYGDHMILSVTDQVMGLPGSILLYKLAPTLEDQSLDDYSLPIQKITASGNRPKILQAHWGPLNGQIITCNEDGTVRVYDPETGAELNCIHAHQKIVNNLAFSPDDSCFLTASTDHTAKLYDTRSLELIKTYDNSRPVYSSAMSPTLDHVILGGGQSAESVTTTRLDSSQFKVRFYHKIYEEEIASVGGHFGPVNTLAFHPNGRSFVSGGEDGYIRIHPLPETYFSELSNEALYGRGAAPTATIAF